MEATMTRTQTQNWPKAYEHAREQLSLLKVLSECAPRYFDRWARMIQLEQAIALYENGRRNIELYNTMIG